MSTKMKTRKNRYTLLKGDEVIGDSPSLNGIAELADCHLQTIYKTRDGNNFTFDGVVYTIIDKLD